MPEFLTLLQPQEAIDLWIKNFPRFDPRSEQINSIDALNRITAEDVISPEPLPAFSRSTVDGYAVCAAETYGASDSLPAYLLIKGEITMGGQPPFSLGRGECALIHTGGMLPENADAVVMLEYTQTTQKNEIEVMRAVAPLENIICAGEDVITGQVVIPKGTQLRSIEIGGLMALGIQEVSVVEKPRISILSSGDEVVSPENKPYIGQVRDINSFSMSALIEQWGGIPIRYGIIPDNAATLENALDDALAECDAVVITAGSSASSRDITAQTIQKAGEPGVIVHGLNIRPGKPTILGVCNGKPVIGLPGNPVSALVIAWLVFPIFLARLSGFRKDPVREYQIACLSINISSQSGREEWIPVRFDFEDGQLVATPIFFKSNLIFNLAGADGLMYVPADANGIGVGEQVKVCKI